MMSDATLPLSISTEGTATRPELLEFGRAVRRARRAHHLTQAELAGLSGTSQRFVSELESGVRNVTLGKALDVLAVLGLRMHVSDGDG